MESLSTRWRIPHRRNQHQLLASLLVCGLILATEISLVVLGTLVHRGETSGPGLPVRHLTQDAMSFPDDATSACLCVMDDNHFLIEWIAYHYHTANLRHLIITTDPDSLTQPTRILDRWRDKMVIEEWTDSNFLSQEEFEAQVLEKSTNKHGQQDPILQNHRTRQATFNMECLKSLKRQGRGWVLMIDPDEYLTYNPDLTDPEFYAYDSKIQLPAIEEPGSLAHLLDQLILPHPEFDHLKQPCIPVFRRQFAARDSTKDELNAMVPDGFDASNFLTLRWRKYGYKMLKYQARFGDTCHSRRAVPNKVLVDLGRLRYQDLLHPDNKGNPHQPMDAICPSDVYLHRDESPFMVFHYLGTVNQWLYRAGDKRGQGYRIARYEDLNSRIGYQHTDQVRPWLNGFVSSMGEEEAVRLLDGVGILEPLPHNPKTKPEEKPGEKDTPVYKVGDIVQANYKGNGYWYWAEVSKVHSNGYYNVFFAQDCSEEIATPGDRLRRTGKTDEEKTYDIDLQKLALEARK